MTSWGARENRFAFIGAGCLVLLALCAIIGLPLPHNDDLTFAPTGRELAQHGAVWNSQTQHWWPSIPPYYGYPPGGAFINAVWGTVFGFSTSSLAVQYGLWIIVFAFGWRSLAGWAGFGSVVLTIAATACYVSATVSAGYRPDAPALAITFAAAGLAMGDRLWRFALAAFLLAWAVVTGPDGIILEALVVGFLAREIEQRKAITPRNLAPIVCGGSAAILLFTAVIGGRYDIFLTQVSHHASGALVRERTVFDTLLSLHGVLALLCLAVAGSLRAMLHKEAASARMLDLALCFAVGLVLTQFLHRSFVYYTFYLLAAGALMAFAIARASTLPKPLRLVPPIGLAAGLLALNFAWLTYAVTPRASREAHYANARALIETYVAEGRPVFIDANAARSVYRALPPNPVQAWEFASRFPGNLPQRADDICPNKVWVISPPRTRNLLAGVFVEDKPAERGVLMDFIAAHRHRFFFPEANADIAVLECEAGAPKLVYSSDPNLRVVGPVDRYKPL